MNKKFKSVAVIIMVMIAAITGFTACHGGKKDGRCDKQMCCKEDCCKKCDGKECCDGRDCKEKCEKMCKEGKCCMKDSATGMKDGKDCCKKGAKAEAGMYHCPMCKDVSSDKPGKCPKCGMEMEKKE